MFSLADSNFYYLSFFMNTGPGVINSEVNFWSENCIKEKCCFFLLYNCWKTDEWTHLSVVIFGEKWQTHMIFTWIKQGIDRKYTCYTNALIKIYFKIEIINPFDFDMISFNLRVYDHEHCVQIIFGGPSFVQSRI